jgi:nucleotide-binding universal stress UspA family protein
MTFKTILVGVDGSKQAIKTAEIAADIAQRYGAKPLIVHVVAPIFDWRGGSELANLARMEHWQQADYERLQEVGRKIVHIAELSARQKGVANLETLVEVGDPVSVIVNTARTRNADLIALGRRGLGTLTGLLLGSVSHKVTQLADRPCLTVS